MIIRRKGHEVPSLNTTSTADISFMLLIFFLVTTSMDIDKGLARQLPPMEPTKELIEESAVDKKNLLMLEITADNQLMINEHPGTIATLRDKTLNLVHDAGNQHVISLRCDPDADYDIYFQVQNEIVATYNQWRDEQSQKKFRKKYALLNPAQQEEIRKACPHRLAEYTPSITPPSEDDLEEEGGEL